MRPFWLVLNKKTTITVLLIIILLFLALWRYGGTIIYGTGKVPPREILETGLDRTIASESFRYQAETRLVTEGRLNINYFSQVTGERVAPDQIQIKGTIMNTPVELIQIGDNSYYKDPHSGQWITLAGNNASHMEYFYAELNPLAYINFKHMPQIDYQGTTKLNGEKLLSFEIHPILSDPILEFRLTDVICKIWLHPKDHRVRQASIQAREKNNPKGAIEIDISFWDYDKNISINPPNVN